MRASAVTMRLASIAAAGLLLAGCGTVRSEVSLTCPPLQEYTPTKQARAAEQYERLRAEGHSHELLDLVDDYGEVRARCRAIGKRT